jgi:hypothetical protein
LNLERKAGTQAMGLAVQQIGLAVQQVGLLPGVVIELRHNSMNKAHDE